MRGGKKNESMMSGFCVFVSHFLSVTTKNYFGLREHLVDIWPISTGGKLVENQNSLFILPFRKGRKAIIPKKMLKSSMIAVIWPTLLQRCYNVASTLLQRCYDVGPKKGKRYQSIFMKNHRKSVLLSIQKPAITFKNRAFYGMWNSRPVKNFDSKLTKICKFWIQ